MKKHIWSLVALLMILALVLTGCGDSGATGGTTAASGSAKATAAPKATATPKPVNEWEYILNSTEEWACIVRYNGTAEEVVIPDTLGKKPVKEVRQYTFMDAAQITSITIPASVTKIEDLSFYTLPNLKSFTVAEDSVGFIAVDGVLYHKKMATLYCYPQGKTDETYTIPDTVKTINGKAFYNCQLKEIVIPEKVTKILAGAFMGSKNLTKVTLGTKVSQIFEDAFRNCSALEAIDFPASVTSIGSNCFAGCTALKNVVLHDKIATVNNGAFAGCTALETADIRCKSIQRVEPNTFDGCVNLTAVTYASSMKGIAEYAFRGCEKLASFPLEEGLVTLDRGAFEGCAAMTDVTIPSTLTAIGGGAFKGTAWQNALTDEYVIVGDGILLAYNGTATEITLPATVKTVSYVNPIVTRVTVPEGVTAFAAEAFSGCTALTEITLPNTLISIGDYAFENCSALKTLNIPANLETIGDYAFRGCRNMEKYTVDPTNVNFNEEQGVLYDKIKKVLLSFPCNSPLTTYTMTYGPTGMAKGALQGNRNLEVFDASAAESITAFNEYAFADCEKLVNVKTVNTFTKIGAHCFENCAQLGADGAFDLQYTVTDLGECAFKNCVSLKKLTLDSPIAKMGKNIFEGAVNCTLRCYSNGMGEEYCKAYHLNWTKN